MENHDEAGGEIHGFILFIKHTGNNTGYSVEQTVEEGAVMEEETPELFVNGKNTVAVNDINKLKGHGGSALHRV